MTKTPKPIETLGELREHLQTAIELEHATVPAYLTALYTLKEGTNLEAALVLRSVVVEEMLHLTLASNVMNAVGGSPSINSKKFVPEYPTRLPHCANLFEVELERFSEKAIHTFMKIEHPAYNSGSKPKPEPGQYHTIGQFYEAIEEGIEYLCRELGEQKVFTGHDSRQVAPEQYYGSGGRIIVVHDHQTAHSALSEIINQGEGSDYGDDIWEERDKDILGPRDQAAHFYRFDEICQQRYYQNGDKPCKPAGDPLKVDWKAVCPIRANTKSADFPEGSEIRTVLDDFNRAYKDLLNALHCAFNGEPELIAQTIPRMYDLGYKAKAISNIPIPGSNETVGPSWEWVPG